MSFSASWDRARRILAPAIEHGGTHNERDVFDAVVSGAAQLWMLGDSAAVTEIVSYPRVKACRMWLAAGNLEEILEIERQIEDWARGIGCARLEMIGRKGWLKKLKHWRTDARVLMTRGI
jgi:hypothetical protein